MVLFGETIEEEVARSFLHKFEGATTADVRRYIQFRAGNTLKNYGSQYRRLKAFGEKIGKSFVDWSESDMLRLLGHLENSAVSAASLTTISAVINLLAETSDTPNLLDKPVLRKSIKSMMKQANLNSKVPKLKRRAMSLQDVNILTEKWKCVSTTIPEKQVIIASILSYLAVRRSREIRLLKWTDVDVNDKAKTITINLATHKTDKTGSGYKFMIDAGGAIDLAGKMMQYRDLIPGGVKCVFPKFTKRGVNKQREIIDVPISESAYRSIMKSFQDWGVAPGLLPHSSRIGAVTTAVQQEQGPAVKKAGLWASDAVELYDRNCANLKISKMLNSLH